MALESKLKLNVIVEGESKLQELVEQMRRSLANIKELSEDELKKIGQNIGNNLRKAIRKGTEFKASDLKYMQQAIGYQAQLLDELKLVNVSELTDKEAKRFKKVVKETEDNLNSLVKAYKGAYGKIEKAQLDSFKRRAVLDRKLLELAEKSVIVPAGFKVGKAKIDAIVKINEMISRFPQRGPSYFTDPKKYNKMLADIEKYLTAIRKLETESAGGIMAKAQVERDKQASINIRNLSGQSDLLAKLNALHRRYITDVDKVKQIETLRNQVLAQSADKLARNTKLYAEYTKKIKELGVNLDAQRNSMGILSHAWEKFRLIFARVAHALTSFMIINTVYRVVTGFVRSLISSNQQIEVLEARLNSLIPSSDKLKNIWESLTELTIFTPFTLQQFVEASATIRAFGVDIEKNMKAIADWASATSSDLNETAVAFAKISAYSPRTALLLSTRGISPTLFKSYLNEYGNATVALNKLIEDLYSGTAKRISLTFQGMLSNINDLWIIVSQKLGEQVFQDLKSYVRTIFEFLNKLAKHKSTIEKIGSLISSLVKGVIYGLVVSGFALVTATIIRGIKYIRSLVTGVESLANAMRLAKINTALLGAGIALLGTYLADRLISLKSQMSDIRNSMQNAFQFPHGSVERIAEIKNALASVKSTINSINFDPFMHLINVFVPSFKRGLISLKASLEESLRIQERIAQAQERSRAIRSAQFTAEEIEEIGITKHPEVLNKIREQFKKVREETYKYVLGLDAFARVIIQNDIGLIQYAQSLLEHDKIKDEQKKALTNYINRFQLLYTLLHPKEITDISKSLKSIFELPLETTQDIASAKTAIAETLKSAIEYYDKVKGKTFDYESVVRNLTSEQERYNGVIETTRSSLEDLANTKYNKIKGIIEKINSAIKDSKYEELGISQIREQNVAELFNYMSRLQITEQEISKINSLSKEEAKSTEASLKKRIEIGSDIAELIKLLIDLNKELATTYDDIYNRLVSLRYEFDSLNNSLSEFLMRLEEDKYTRAGLLVPREVIEEQINYYRNEQKRLLDEIDKFTSRYGELNESNIKRQLEKLKTNPKELREYLDALGSINDYQNKYLDALDKEYKLIENLENRVDDFTSGMRDAVRTLNEEVSRAWENVGRNITSGLTEAISTSMKYIISPSTYTKDIDKSIKDLRAQLDRVRAEKQGIKIVEDEEIKIMNEINRLENERANILKNQINAIINRIKESLIDIIAQYVASEILSGFIGESEAAKNRENIEKKIRDIKIQTATISALLAEQEVRMALERKRIEEDINRIKISNYLMGLAIGAPNIPAPVGSAPSNANVQSGGNRNVHINFYGDIYGMEEFNSKVEQVMQKYDKVRVK